MQIEAYALLFCFMPAILQDIYVFFVVFLRYGVSVLFCLVFFALSIRLNVVSHTSAIFLIFHCMYIVP